MSNQHTSLLLIISFLSHSLTRRWVSAASAPPHPQTSIRRTGMGSEFMNFALSRSESTWSSSSLYLSDSMMRRPVGNPLCFSFRETSLAPAAKWREGSGYDTNYKGLPFIQITSNLLYVRLVSDSVR